jgi:hypothetical protein
MGICTVCNRPIRWSRLQRGLRVPLDPSPNEKGQIILLRDGLKAMTVDPFEDYEPEVRERRFYDHRSTCLGSFYSVRTLGGSLSDTGKDVGGIADKKRRLREVQLLLDEGWNQAAVNRPQRACGNIEARREPVE